MAAPTHTYCDYATGNDYKGATFTDGAYTSATKTLVKAGAFAASKVNHWLYLSGTNITTGYYKIATVTDANTVILATDAGSDSTAVACTQHDGTTSLPWRSVQGALDLITRDATNGDQVNVKAGTAEVLAASLTLTTYGTPAETAPLIIRGYTSTAGDGGIGEINCNGVTMWASNYSYVWMVELECHNFGNANGVILSSTVSALIKCEVHKGASTPSSRTLVTAICVGCHIHDAGTTGIGIASGASYYNYVKDCPTGISLPGVAVGNLVVDCAAIGIDLGDFQVAIGNSVYSSSAATGYGIGAATNRAPGLVINNIVEGYSGAGGDGLFVTTDIYAFGYNAFYNNTAAETLADTFLDLGNDVTLAASAFTNPGGGDFSLTTTTTAKEVAFPGAWYGLAGTTNKQDIGAVQLGAGAGGGVIRRVMRLLGG